MSCRLRIGDEVIVITGKDRGKIGKILKFDKSERSHKVVVSGVKAAKKSVKPSAKNAGGFVFVEMPLDISNVSFFDSKSGRPSRIGYEFNQEGKKVRVLKVSGRILG